VKRVYQINIFDQEVSVKTDADEERVREIAAYLQQKFAEIKSIARNASHPDQMALTALDIANDLFDMQKRISDLKSHVEEKSNGMISRIESIS